MSLSGKDRVLKQWNGFKRQIQLQEVIKLQEVLRMTKNAETTGARLVWKRVRHLLLQNSIVGGSKAVPLKADICVFSLQNL